MILSVSGSLSVGIHHLKDVVHVKLFHSQRRFLAQVSASGRTETTTRRCAMAALRYVSDMPSSLVDYRDRPKAEVALS